MSIDFAQQYVRDLATGDVELIARWYHPDARSYGPLAWPAAGARSIAAGLARSAARLDGLQTELHDVFADAAGDRAALRLVRRWSQGTARRSAIETRYLRLADDVIWRNTGTFFGLPPTGDHGAHAEFHSLRVADGRITEQVVTDISYGIPRYELTVWHREYPADTEDPAPQVGAGGP